MKYNSVKYSVQKWFDRNNHKKEIMGNRDMDKGKKSVANFSPKYHTYTPTAIYLTVDPHTGDNWFIHGWSTLALSRYYMEIMQNKRDLRSRDQNPNVSIVNRGI